MGIYSIKPWFRSRLEVLVGGLSRRGVTPDQITAAGVAFSVAGGAAIAAGQWSRWWWLAVPLLALLRTAANALDGLVAQRTGQARPAGELWNETADRLGDAAFLGGAALLPGLAPLALGALATAELASFVGITARAAGGTRRYDGPMGKPDRMALVSLAAIVALAGWEPAWEAGLYVVVAGALVTALNRYLRSHRELEAAGQAGTI